MSLFMFFGEGKFVIIPQLYLDGSFLSSPCFQEVEELIKVYKLTHRYRGREPGWDAGDEPTEGMKYNSYKSVIPLHSIIQFLYLLKLR